ncbi:MAG: hypothetical protein ACK5LK_04945, partial [Chthoniobacterales bacterium]
PDNIGTTTYNQIVTGSFVDAKNTGDYEGRNYEPPGNNGGGALLLESPIVSSIRIQMVTG